MVYMMGGFSDARYLLALQIMRGLVETEGKVLENKDTPNDEA